MGPSGPGLCELGPEGPEKTVTLRVRAETVPKGQLKPKEGNGNVTEVWTTGT